MYRDPAVVAGFSVLVVLGLMLVELIWSRRNERVLRRQGAFEAPDEVYRAMRWAYPGVFVAMAVEGSLWGPAPGIATAAGATLFLISKALKVWAIASLGSRWTYRVLVLPGAPLIARGPYAFMRHPNYVAVLGELLAMALLVGARASGPVGLLFFGALLRRRVRAEEHALY